MRDTAPNRNRRTCARVIPWLLITPCLVACSTSGPWRDKADHLAHSLAGDYATYYRSPHVGVGMSATLGTGAVLANTELDEDFQTWYQRQARNADADDLARAIDHLGEGQYVIPVFVAAYVWDEARGQPGQGSTVSEWGERCLRTVAIAGPQTWVLQHALGASRPDEGVGSRWRPFEDNNAVSGHTMIGATALLSAAHVAENPCLKTGLFIGSTFPAWARTHLDAHYLSQSVMGWAITAVAAHHVNTRYEGSPKVSWDVLPGSEAPTVGFTVSY